MLFISRNAVVAALLPHTDVSRSNRDNVDGTSPQRKLSVLTSSAAVTRSNTQSTIGSTSPDSDMIGPYLLQKKMSTHLVAEG